MLIECKRSQHPYIFFKNVTERPILHFPAISGLRNKNASIYEQSMKRSQDVLGAAVLGIDKVPFVDPGPPKCSAFSKGVPSGKKIELSGSDPFNTLILPLVKALDHALELYRAIEGPTTLYPTLLFCISVIDAPMILRDSPDKVSDPILCPWVRVVRHEANPDPRSWMRFRYYAVDAVHIDFFEEFLHKNLLPYAKTFASRARQLESVLFKGGVVDSLDSWEWSQIRPKDMARR